MRYIEKFKSFESYNISNYQIFLDILSGLEDDLDLKIEVTPDIQYYCDTDNIYNGHSFFITSDNNLDIFRINDNFEKILDMLQKYATENDYKIVIDPENRSMEYLPLDEFIESYSGEELTEIDIIVYYVDPDDLDDDFINESMLHFSPKFRKTLEIIDPKDDTGIAQELLKSELTDVKPDMTLIDISNDRVGDITFMQIDKADKKIKEVLPNIDIDIKSPESNKSIEALYFKDISNDMNIGIYKGPGRNATSIGKLVGKVFPGKYTPKQIEDFVNKFKSEISDVDFKIVEGEEIRKWYMSSNYEYNGGTLGGSCMNGGEYVDLYIINPDRVRMVILLKEGKLLGRALLWKIDDQKFKYLLDRIYYTEDHTVNKFIDFVNKNGWAHKTLQSHSTFQDITFNNNEYSIKLSIKIDNLPKSFPYVDTFQFLDIKDSIITNYYSNTTTHRLESTHGSKTILRYYSKYNDRYLDQANAVRSRHRNDYLTREQSVYVNDDWVLEEDTLYSDYGDYYIMKGDEVQSETFKSLLDKKKSVEVIMDEEGNTDWLPKGKWNLYDEVKSKYYHVDLLIKDFRGDSILKSEAIKVKKIKSIFGDMILDNEIYDSIDYFWNYSKGVRPFNEEWNDGSDVYVSSTDDIYRLICNKINPFYWIHLMSELKYDKKFNFSLIDDFYNKLDKFSLQNDFYEKEQKNIIFDFFRKDDVTTNELEDRIQYEFKYVYPKIKQIRGYELNKTETLRIALEIIVSPRVDLREIDRQIRYIFPDESHYMISDITYKITSNIYQAIESEDDFYELVNIYRRKIFKY